MTKYRLFIRAYIQVPWVPFIQGVCHCHDRMAFGFTTTITWTFSHSIKTFYCLNIYKENLLISLMYMCPLIYFNPATLYCSACTKPGKRAIMYLCVRAIHFCLFLPFFYWILELLWQYGIFCLSFYLIAIIRIQVYFTSDEDISGAELDMLTEERLMGMGIEYVWM
jgi:hypothetical protein